MKNPFRRKTTSRLPREIHITHSALSHSVTVTHKYDPKPMPNSMEVVFEDNEGRQWRNVVNMYGQSEGYIELPISFITGGVFNKQARARVLYYYEGRRR